MSNLRRGLLTLSCLICLSMAVGYAEEPERSRTVESLLTGPEPAPVAPVSADERQAAITRGVDFLLAKQNPGGSWGSATQTKGLNIYAPVPGAHLGFRAAVTSLCVSALIQSGDQRPEVAQAINRAEAWLVEHLPEVRRADATAIYNVWAHGYALQALHELHRLRAGDPDRQAKLRELMEGQVDRLVRYAGLSGGWGYYDFGAHTQIPNAEPTSFTTAAILIALKDVQPEGVALKPAVLAKALASLQRQKKPDFAYYYSDNGPTRNRPMWAINRPGGSLGRSQACNLALRMWGDETVTDEVLRVWLDRLLARNGWLDIGRKRPVPHESHFLVAGYFFYFGHYYAARCIEELPESDRAEYRDQLARILLPLQEKDGSWWDFPFYDYHQQYGTAMAIMALSAGR
ncbi:MAG: prenyltransferase/squalene oxidase repeat-containing protein [Pirellulales bacterium]